MKFIHVIERKQAKSLGLGWYFTGRPCKYGHFSERRTSIGHCVECLNLLQAQPAAREARKTHYRNNHVRILEDQKRYRESLPKEVLKERKRLEAERNSDKYVERMRAWRAADPKRASDLNRAVYFKNHERNKERNRAWRLKNPEREAALKASKRSATRKATPFWGTELTLFVHEEALKLARQREVIFGFPWHVDHMVPLRHSDFAGLHVWYNLQVIPAHLNLYKGNRLMFTQPFEWMGHQS